MSAGNNSVHARVDLSSINSMLDQLGDDIEGAVRQASQAAAQVFYDQVHINLAAIGKKTGNLESSIYQKFSPEHSTDSRAQYHVSWNAKKAPHGGLLEGGHVQRYKAFIGSDGKYYTMKQAGSKEKKKPGRNASQAEKDAYYVKLDTPIQRPGYFFVRKALDHTEKAVSAAKQVIFNRIAGVNNES